MAISGEIKTLYSDGKRTKVLLPVTKTKAVSNDQGVGLDALLENLPYYSKKDDSTAAAAPIDADTLGGRLASDYATESFVTNKIAEAQISGGSGSGSIDLSGFATKDDIAKIDYPVDSVNGKTGAVTLSASDVNALGNIGNQILENGTLKIEDPANQGHSFEIDRTVGSDKIGVAFSTGTDCAGVWFSKNGNAVNNLLLMEDATHASKPFTIASGGTGATDAATARANLGAAPASYINGYMEFSTDEELDQWIKDKFASMSRMSTSRIIVAIQSVSCRIRSAIWVFDFNKLVSDGVLNAYCGSIYLNRSYAGSNSSLSHWLPLAGLHTSNDINSVGWYRIGWISYPSSYTISISNTYANTQDTVATVEAFTRHGESTLVKIGGLYKAAFDQVRLVYNASKGIFYVDFHYNQPVNNPCYASITPSNYRVFACRAYENIRYVADADIDGTVSSVISLN